MQKNFRKEAAKKHGSNGPDGSMPACRCMGRNYACWKNKVSISRKRICEPGNFKMCLEVHMPEFMYIEETGKESFEKWLINQMELLFPIGYMANGEEEKTLAVEDEDTYRLILKKQAEDENEVLGGRDCKKQQRRKQKKHRLQRYPKRS